MSHQQTSAVSIVKLESYDPDEVDDALARLLRPLGGMERFVSVSSTPVIKPNLLRPSPIESAVCTHPEIVRAAARSAIGCGAAAVAVTDSPGIGTAKRNTRQLGMGGPGEPFTVEDVEGGGVTPPGAAYNRLFLADRMMSADPLINIAKAKTHGQMVVTGAVKNTFGAVIGLEKTQWHYRAGRDPMSFARLIVDIHQMLSPALSIVDGVIGMEGNGPGAGDPRPMGVLLAGTNAHAVDTVMCRLMDVDPQEVYTLRVAREKGLLPEAGVEIVGPSPESLRPSPSWRRARPNLVRRMAGPEWMIPLIDRFLSLRPAVSLSECTGCGRCIEACAAKAVSLTADDRRPNQYVVIDKKKCISCFCCQEMCPQGAITVRTGPVARLMGLGRRGKE